MITHHFIVFQAWFSELFGWPFWAVVGVGVAGAYLTGKWSVISQSTQRSVSMAMPILMLFFCWVLTSQMGYRWIRFGPSYYFSSFKMAFVVSLAFAVSFIICLVRAGKKPEWMVGGVCVPVCLEFAYQFMRPFSDLFELSIIWVIGSLIVAVLATRSIYVIITSSALATLPIANVLAMESILEKGVIFRALIVGIFTLSPHYLLRYLRERKQSDAKLRQTTKAVERYKD